MKKLLITTLILSNLILPVLADNLLQQEYENKYYQEHFKSTPLANIDNWYLIQEDYNTYTTKGGSIIGTYDYKYEDLKVKSSNIAQYYRQMIDSIKLGLSQNSNINQLKIEDEDYKKFDNSLKEDIAMYNSIVAYRPLIIEEEQENKNTQPKKKSFKEKFKEVDKALNLGLYQPTFAEEQAEIEASLKAPYIAREKMVKKYNKVIDAINERAINTALLSFEGNIKDGEGNTYSGEQLLTYIDNINNQVDKLYSHFQQTPNDIKSNNELIKIMGTNKGYYNSLLEATQRDFIDKSYKTYVKSYKSQFQRENISLKDGSVWLISAGLNADYVNGAKPMEGNEYLTAIYEHNPPMYQAHIKMLDSIKDFDTKAQEVSEYSYNYEKQKYENWIAKNNKKRISGALETFVYGYGSSPVTGALYKHHPTQNLFLKVLQSVPGGVILTGSYRVGNGMYNINPIFLQTTKTFADGQYIREPLMAEFKGYYDYTTVLGARKRIYKFYRLGQKEIDANFNIPGQPFYFYQPY